MAEHPSLSSDSRMDTDEPKLNSKQHGAPPSIGTLFGQMSAQISSLIRGEIELTKTKAAAFGKRMGLGIGLLAVAGLFSLYLLGWLFHSIEELFALLLPPWGAALVVTGILVFIVLLLALLGVRELRRAKNSVPEPKVGLNASVDAFKKGLRHE